MGSVRLHQQGYSVFMGTGIAKLLEKEVTIAGERVWVVSPWVSPRLLELLGDRAPEIDVRLATREAPLGLRVKRFAPSLPLFLAASVAFFVSRPIALALLLAGLFLALKPSSKRLRFTRLPDDVHVKAYIIDNTAYLGSVNFTESGLFYNYESLIAFKDRRTVSEIEKEIRRLFRK